MRAAAALDSPTMSQTSFAEVRAELQAAGLDRADLADDPMEQLRRWYDQAIGVGLHEAEAFVLSTVGADGVPSSRYVLMRGLDHGVVFFTNRDSRKGRELAANPAGAACFPWHVLSRQVRLVGAVGILDDEASDAYFATRPRSAQIGAWASAQSEPLSGRAELEGRVEEVEARFAGIEVPRPAHWGGYRLVPHEVEVWQGRPSRLHDRFRYARDGGSWIVERLSP
jgi:pyridoxamine 5'-phosphate oxidase